jgi:hypothetical protein
LISAKCDPEISGEKSLAPKSFLTSTHVWLAPPAVDLTALNSNSTTDHSVLSVKLVVAAVVVDMPLMDLLVHLALMDNPEEMDNLANPVMMDNPDPEEHPNKLPTGASTVNPDHPDLPVTTEIVAVLEDLDNQEIPDKEADKDHPVPLDHPDHQEILEIPEGMDNLEALDKFMKFPAQKDLPAHQDQMVIPAAMDNLVAQATQGVTVDPDLKVMQVAPEAQEGMASLAMLEVMENPVDTALATTAHLLVPLLVIKPKSESNKKIPLNHPKIFSTGNLFLVFFGLFLVKNGVVYSQ